MWKNGLKLVEWTEFVKNTSNNIVPTVILFNVLVKPLICGFVIFTRYLIVTRWLNNDYCGFFLTWGELTLDANPGSF